MAGANIARGYLYGRESLEAPVCLCVVSTSLRKRVENMKYKKNVLVPKDSISQLHLHSHLCIIACNHYHYNNNYNLLRERLKQRNRSESLEYG